MKASGKPAVQLSARLWAKSSDRADGLSLSDARSNVDMIAGGRRSVSGNVSLHID